MEQREPLSEVGAVWDKDSGLSGKLTNGMPIWLFVNTNREAGDNRPSFRICMRESDANKFGIAKPKNDQDTASTANVPF